jgi:hypothetical protein
MGLAGMVLSKKNKPETGLMRRKEMVWFSVTVRSMIRRDVFSNFAGLFSRSKSGVVSYSQNVVGECFGFAAS